MCNEAAAAAATVLEKRQRRPCLLSSLRRRSETSASSTSRRSPRAGLGGPRRLGRQGRRGGGDRAGFGLPGGAAAAAATAAAWGSTRGERRVGYPGLEPSLRRVLASRRRRHRFATAPRPPPRSRQTWRRASREPGAADAAPRPGRWGDGSESTGSHGAPPPPPPPELQVSPGLGGWAGKKGEGRGGGGARAAPLKRAAAGAGAAQLRSEPESGRAGVRLFMFRSGPLKCFPRRRRQSLWRLRLFFQSPALLPPRPSATPSQRRARARGRRGKLLISLSARGLRGQAWVRAQTGPCHFQKKGKPGKRASSSVGICQGSSRAATATFGVCEAYSPTGIVPYTPFPVKNGRRGQVGT